MDRKMGEKITEGQAKMDSKLTMTIGNKSRKMKGFEDCYRNFPTEKITEF